MIEDAKKRIFLRENVAELNKQFFGQAQGRIRLASN